MVSRHNRAHPGYRVSHHDLHLLLVSSMRYALGRSSYITGWCADVLRQYGPHLEISERSNLIRDLWEELSRAQRDGRTVGMAMDHRIWLDALRDLGAQQWKAVHRG